MDTRMRDTYDDLRNWGRAMNDEWLEHNLMPKTHGIFREYRPPAGDTFDPEYSPPPIDQDRADQAEKIVIQIGLRDFDAHQALILYYCHRKSIEEIAKMRHWSFPFAKKKRQDGEKLFMEYSRMQRKAA